MHRVRDQAPPKAAGGSQARAQPQVPTRRVEEMGFEAPLLSGIVAESEEAIIGKALDGTIISWNPGAERLFGYSVAEATGQPDSIIIPPDRRDEEAQVMARITRGERVERYETVMVGKDGRRIDVSVGAFPVRDASGQITAAVAMAHDISQRKRAEKALREREELLRLVALNSPDIIFTQDHDLHYTWLAHRRTPFRMEQVLGHTDADFFSGEMLRRFVAPKRMVLESGEGATVEGGVRMAGVPCRFEATYQPQFDGQGRVVGLFGYIHDITERKRAEQQREDVLRAVSHDLRNPLTVVQANAQMLLRALDRAGLNGPERRTAENILGSARRMNAMIQDLVDVTGLEAGTLRMTTQPVDLAAFIRQLKERQAPVLEAGRIRVEAPDALPPVLADPDRLERIVVNLLSNALQYSTRGTEVTVALSQRDGEVVTAVTDRGPGIPPEELPRLFERFYRAEAARRQPAGLGLGLYITRLLVEAQGGHVWAESEVGVGSTFSFSLPVAP